MLIDQYAREDAFAQVPQLAAEIDPVLRCLDTLLDDDQLSQQVQADFGQRHRYTLIHGRHSTLVEVLLRMLILKHLYQWNYRELEGRVKDSLVLRWFCRVVFQAVPDASTLWWLRTDLAPGDNPRSQRSSGAISQTGEGDQRPQAALGCHLCADDHSSSHR